MVLRVPAVDRVLVALVQQQPFVLSVAAGAGADQHETAAQLLAVHVEMQLAGGQRGGRIVGVRRLPGAVVPDDDVAAAVLAGPDDTLEIAVTQRVVLDLESRPADFRVERRAFRHRPARQRAAHLQPEVVMQPPRPVTLHDESAGGGLHVAGIPLSGGPDAVHSFVMQSFLWGVATAGHQIEGDNTASDTWFAENVQPTVFRERSGKACDGYAKSLADVDLVAGMGLSAYRFSVKLARVEP